MKQVKLLAISIVVGLLSTLGLLANEDPGGQVQLPLGEYTTLLQQATDPTKPPRPAPVGYALGNATVTVTVSGLDQRASSRDRSWR